MNPWQLPQRAQIGQNTYDLNTDYRDILEIFRYLEDPDLPEYIRWQIALGLFYRQSVPDGDMAQAIEYLCQFIRCGQQESTPAPKLLDWQQDAPLIIADINAAAGQEIRSVPYLHWWSFMAWFYAIGQGQLSTVVTIRQKLATGRKLESWEQTYYRQNRQIVELPKRYSRQELQQKQQLEALLDTSKGR